MTDFTSSIFSAQIKEASNVFMWLSFGIYFSDTLSFVKWDLSLFNTKKTFKWSHILYLLSKVGVWVYFFTQIAIRWTEKEVDCGAALYGLEFLSAFCILSSSVVLAHRSIQLFKDRVQRNVSILLSILLLILAVAWILSIQDIKSHWDIKSGQVWQDGACQIDRVEAAFPTKFGLTLLFLLVLIGLFLFSQRSTSMESENGSLATSTLSLTALSILNLVILILSARNLNSQLDILFQIPFIVFYNMVALRSHFNLCSRTEIPNTSKIIAQMNHSQLTFESNKVENGCRSPVIIQMEVDRTFTRVEDSSSYENEKSVSLSIPSSNSKGLGINDQKSQQSQTQSPTRSNFTRTSNSTSVRSKVSHSRSAIYIVDDLALENETQMQLESTPPPKNRSLIPFKYSSPQKFVSSLSVSPSPSSKRFSSVEPKRSLQDPWNQVEPSPSLSPSPSTSSNQMMSTSTPPLKVSPKNPLRSKPYANKSKRPLTPKKSNKDQGGDERPNTANSYTQRMAIALEFNSSRH